MAARKPSDVTPEDHGQVSPEVRQLVRSTSDASDVSKAPPELRAEVGKDARSGKTEIPRQLAEIVASRDAFHKAEIFDRFPDTKVKLQLIIHGAVENRLLIALNPPKGDKKKWENDLVVEALGCGDALRLKDTGAAVRANPMARHWKVGASGGEKSIAKAKAAVQAMKTPRSIVFWGAFDSPGVIERAEGFELCPARVGGWTRTMFAEVLRGSLTAGDRVTIFACGSANFALDVVAISAPMGLPIMCTGIRPGVQIEPLHYDQASALYAGPVLKQQRKTKLTANHSSVDGALLQAQVSGAIDGGPLLNIADSAISQAQPPEFVYLEDEFLMDDALGDYESVLDVEFEDDLSEAWDLLHPDD